MSKLGTPDWNLLLYALAGDDTEHQRVTQAIDDMQGALKSTRCNVAVQVHAKSKTTRHWISAGKVRSEVLPVVADAGEPSTLTSFLNAANRAYPDRSTAVVLWAHSTGLDHVHAYRKKAPVRQSGVPSVFGAAPGAGPGLGGGVDVGDPVGDAPARSHDASVSYGSLELDQAVEARPESYGCRWGPDPNTNQFLTNVGMKKAIAASTRGRVEVLGLNACWMASLEIEFELRNVSDVLIASQVEALPWPYGAIATTLSSGPECTTERFATTIVDCVRAEIRHGKRYDAVSALWSGAAMDALAAAFDAYAKRVTTLIDSDWESVAKAVTVQTPRVDDPDALDLLELVAVLGKDDLKAKIAAAAVGAKFRAMHLASAASSAHPHVNGLSVFCPRTTSVDLAAAYTGTEFRTNSWTKFLQRFQRCLGASA